MECASGRVDRVGLLEVRPGSADARGLRFAAAGRRESRRSGRFSQDISIKSICDVVTRLHRARHHAVGPQIACECVASCAQCTESQLTTREIAGPFVHSVPFGGGAMRALLFMPLAATLAGCTQKIPEISRFDGLAPSPAQKEQAMTECQAKSRVTQADSRASYQGGLAGAFASMAVKDDAFTACMAEKGLRVTWHDVPESGPPAATGSLPQR
jgi:hypothetical protein